MFVTGQATVWDAGPDALIALRGRLNTLSPGNVNIVRADHWFSYYNEAHHLPFNITLLQDMEITSSPTGTNAKYAFQRIYVGFQNFRRHGMGADGLQGAV